MKTITELAELYDIFLLDCDGVLWQGSNVIDRSFEVISWLCQQKGKKVFFVSNSSGRTRDDYVEKIRNLGFQGCTRNMIYGSAYTTAKYLREKFPEIKKIYVVGMNSIRKEMAEVGIESHGGEDDESFSHDKLMTLDEFENYQLDPNVQAVVVGHDLKYTYAKLCIASMYIHSGGAKFIACNDDAYDMIKDRRVPGAGAMVAGIKYSLGQLERDQSSTRHDSDQGPADTIGRSEPLVIGKPNPWAVELIQKERDCPDKSRMIMIGDRLDTDILMANSAGIDSCLVFTGVTSSEEDMRLIMEKNQRAHPKYIMKSFGIIEDKTLVKSEDISQSLL